MKRDSWSVYLWFYWSESSKSLINDQSLMKRFYSWFIFYRIRESETIAKDKSLRTPISSYINGDIVFPRRIVNTFQTFIKEVGELKYKRWRTHPEHWQIDLILYVGKLPWRTDPFAKRQVTVKTNVWLSYNNNSQGKNDKGENDISLGASDKSLEANNKSLVINNIYRSEQTINRLVQTIYRLVQTIYR